MFCYFGVDLVVEFAVVPENCVHFLELLDDEMVFMNDRLHCDPSAYEHLVYRHELSQLGIEDQVLKLLNFVLKRNH